MRLRLLAAFLLLSPLAALSQTYFGVNGWCTVGAQATVTQGLSSSGTKPISGGNFSQNSGVLASYPKCTITVYDTGTTNISTIYSNAAGNSLSNPFTGNTDGSFLFFGVAGCYDVVTSSGVTTGSTMPSNKTYTDVCVGNGGGGGTIGPGTVPHIAKFISSTNVGDSVGVDDGISLTQWPLGLTAMGSAYGKLYPNSPNGTADNLLACIDTTVTSVAEVTTCPTSTTKAVGIIHAGSGGVSGNAQVAMLGFDQCVFDNQTVVGDYAGPSTTVAGDCSDLGPSRPSGTQGIGRITTLNTGAGTLATIDLGPWDLFSPGSSGSANCSFNNVNAFFLTGDVVCDQLVTDDAIGNMTMKSLGLTDTSKAGFMYQIQGAAPSLTVSNAVYLFAPIAVTTYGLKWPANGATAGCLGGTSDGGSPPTITLSFNGSACGTGSGTEVQVNGVDTTAQTPINFQDSAVTFDNYQITETNPSAGNIKPVLTTPNSQISTPSAPTLSTNGSAGSTTISYKVVACEDGPTCAYHTAASSGATITTANATLSGSNSVNLTVYADTLYGPRCYNIYRTATNGTSPTTTGLIANCVWKKFIDTGLAGDSSTAPTDNNTVLKPSYTYLPACARHPDVPVGIDSPPCSPNTTDDEFTATFGNPADANSPFWTWMNQNSATATLTGGMLSLNAPDRASANNLNCLYITSPSTPYTYEVGGAYTNLIFSGVTGDSGTGAVGTGLGLSDGTKLTIVGTNAVASANSGRIGVGKWTNTTTASAAAVVGQSETTYAPLYLKVQDDGTNVKYSTSTDGVIFVQQFSEARGAFFTTGPTRVVLCIDNFSKSNTYDIDFFRRTQ